MRVRGPGDRGRRADDIDFGVRSTMFEFTIITSALDEDAAYAKLQRAAGYVF